MEVQYWYRMCKNDHQGHSAKGDSPCFASTTLQVSGRSHADQSKKVECVITSVDIRLESRVGRRTSNIFGGRDKEVPGEKWKGTL